MSNKGMQTNGGHLDEESLSAYRDGELTAAERVKVDAHLAECERCRRVLRGYELMATALRDQPFTAPAGLRSDLYARLGAPSHRFAWWPALASAATVAIALFVATSLFGAPTAVQPASAFPLPDATAVALTTSVEIVYPAGVDHAAVAAAVQIEPAVPVQKTWQGDTLVLTPEQPLKPDTTYSVRAPAAQAPRVLPPLPVANVSQSPTPAVITKFTTQPGSAAVAAAPKSSPTAVATRPVAQPTETRTQTPAVGAVASAPSATPSASATAPVQPTAIPVVPTPIGSVGTASVPATATPTTQGPLADLTVAAQQNQVRGRIGQSAGDPTTVQVIEQAYENGRMLWRGDQQTVYVLQSDGKWAAFADTSSAGDDAATATPTPQGPVAKGRFNKILSERDTINRQLGKAVGPEVAGQGAVQEFANGTLLATGRQLGYALFANHRWLKIGDAPQDTAPIAAPVSAPATPTAAPSARPAATATPAPTAAEMPTPTACAVSVLRGFGQVYADSGIAGRLGCATEPERQVQLTAQAFEGGRLLGRGDTRTSYVLNGDGTWVAFPDTYSDGDALDLQNPPKGLVAPAHGFGKLWRQQQDVRKGMGWALAPERSVAGTVQNFAGGSMISTGDGEIVIVFADGHWESHHDVYKD